MGISVAMCTYNGSRFLDEQLSSIKNQLRPPDELVVCDDGSRDDTVQKLQDFAKQAPFRVRIELNETNLGSTKNFEKAISLCSGEIIALADQDDIWLSNRLQKTEAAFIDPRAELVFGDAEIIDSKSVPTGLRLWKSENFTENDQLQFRQGKAMAVLLRHPVVTGATVAFRSRLREVVLPIPETWMHDAWIALLTSVLADIIAVPEALIQYRQHSDQQIGPSDPGWLRRAGITNIASRAQFELQVRQLDQLRQRLLQFANTERQSKLIQHISGRISHIAARSRMPERRLGRIPVILRELVTLRYSAYSRGLMSAVRDFMI